VVKWTAEVNRMEKTTAFEAIPKVDAEYEAAIDQYLAEMKRMTEQMTEKQRQIDKLQAETQAALKSVLEELEIS
jgi:uncharacterized protein YecA (UPF0149 family)